MKTYQVFRDERLVGDHISITEAMKLIPAGSKLVSGNQTKQVGNEEVLEIKGSWRIPCNEGNVTIYENK